MTRPCLLLEALAVPLQAKYGYFLLALLILLKRLMIEIRPTLTWHPQAYGKD